MRLLARGATNRAIADALVVREGTVKYHVKNILSKLGATSRTDAVARFHPLQLAGRATPMSATRSWAAAPRAAQPPGSRRRRRAPAAGAAPGSAASRPGHAAARADRRAQGRCWRVRRRPRHGSWPTSTRLRWSACATALTPASKRSARVHAAVIACARSPRRRRCWRARRPRCVRPRSFERAIAQPRGGGRMIAEATHFSDDEAGAQRVLDELRGEPDPAPASADRDRAAAPPAGHDRDRRPASTRAWIAAWPR